MLNQLEMEYYKEHKDFFVEFSFPNKVKIHGVYASREAMNALLILSKVGVILLHAFVPAEVTDKFVYFETDDMIVDRINWARNKDNPNL